MRRVHTLYIGLSSTNTGTTYSADEIIEQISRYCPSFTVQQVCGYCNGIKEDTLQVTIAHHDTSLIQKTAEILLAQYQQDGIGLTYNGFYQRITRQDVTVLQEVGHVG